MAEEAASGKAYLHSDTDVNGRPVIVIRVQKHVTGAHQDFTKPVLIPHDLEPVSTYSYRCRAKPVEHITSAHQLGGKGGPRACYQFARVSTDVVAHHL